YSEFPAATSTFSGLAILFSLFLGFLGVSNTYASSISISLTGNVNLNILKDNTNPTFGKSTTQTATVTSDHFTGYTLTIAGSNDTGRLVGSNDSTKYLSSITTPLTESQFNTDAHNDQWGFLPSKLNSITNNSYQPSPTATTPTTIDVTNSPTTGENYTLALAARVSSNMSLDSYGQTFVLAATGNGYDYNISYKDPMDDLPAAQSGNTQSDSVTISSDIPTRDGYDFAGWCTKPTMTTVCPGDTYQPGNPYDLVSTSANNVILYAMWTPRAETFDAVFAAAGKTKTNGYYAMQDMTSSICSSVATGSAGTLIDTRNNQTYAVAKYLDGHCWMRENLNYAFTAGGTVVAYDFSTGNTFNYTTPYDTRTTTGEVWAEDASDGAKSYGGDKDKYIGGMNIADAGVVKDTGEPYERIGVLYNWAAATAQTGAQAAAVSGETEVKTSICPKGWRLPANSGDYSFSTLMGSYSLPTTNQSQGYSGQLQNPLNFNRPGHYYWSDGTLYKMGTGGYFWSSVGYSSASAHNLYFYSSAFHPQDGLRKGNGFSVRCVAV
ncbi:InlB B-repeat-containing protein, partial [Candidatus Saccharibacteria bacterium]|nr:InlB B-repeat-containing protein [Candidatus Saccharibacteria bacterium]